MGSSAMIVTGRALTLGKELGVMPNLVIEREILIDAPAEVVWRTITEPDQVSQWFADRVELVVEPGAPLCRRAPGRLG
jgi:hypothetical protein